MRIRLFAALRDIAGTSELEFDAPDVATLREELAAKFGDEFGRILAAGAVIVDEEKATDDRPLQPGNDVALLPPVSGG
jgi:sulfur-carrier protein